MDNRPARRPELDAIRTLVVVGLVFFHAALVFDSSDDFYVKNAETTGVTTVLAGFGVLWAMPALFLIAGFGSWHSMARRGAGGFALERLQRLGVPLVFAVLTFIPVPPWLRLKAADAGYRESFLAFLPRFYDVRFAPSDFPFVLRGEFFETGHLWFVVLLLTFSLVLAPLARWVPHSRAFRARDALARGVARRGVVLLPAVATAAICAVLGMEEAFAGWSRWAYLLFFLSGFVLAADERFRIAMRREAVLAGVVGVVVFGVSGPVLLTAGDDPFTDMTGHAIAARILFGFAGWCWVVAILGLLDRRNVRRAGSGAAGAAAPDGRGGQAAAGADPVGDAAETLAGPRGQPAASATAAATGAGGTGAGALHAERGGVALSRGRRAYRYLAVGALPIYVLHQPIVVAVAYGVVRWEAPIVVKYVVIVIASLGLTLAAYEVLVRRTRATRYLFGMRG